jgi:trk system potassium uptake protein TrkA
MKASILVVGIGRFGAAAARELETLGHEVLAVDRDEALVNDIAPEVTHAARLDATDEAALRSVGAGEFAIAIVAISDAMDASIFATMALKQLGVGYVIAKAATPLHGAILERVGADRVVYPEREMGQRIAHSIGIPGVLDYLDVAPRFGIVKVRPPDAAVGRTLASVDGATGIEVVALRRGDEMLLNPGPDTELRATDEIIAMGRDDALERLGR